MYNDLPFNPEIKYKQPFLNFTGRNVDQQYEQVNFVPESYIRIWCNNQDEGYSIHHHDAFEVIIGGSRNYMTVCNNVTYSISPEDILIIPPHMSHELKKPNGGYRFIFQFDIPFFSNLHDSLLIHPVFAEPFFCSKDIRPRIHDKLLPIFQHSIRIYFENDVMWETLIFSDILKILSILTKDFYHSLSPDGIIPNESKPREYINKINFLLDYLENHYAEDITLDQASSLINFSKYHFSRLFKQYTNQTFYDYLTGLRIRQAQSLLSSEQSITEISMQCGFNSPTAFCRCFKKVAGCSPSEYRLQNLRRK